MDVRQSRRITVYGRVQGVGFRPALCRLGKELSLKGFVRNAGGYVEILASGNMDALALLVKKIYGLPQPVEIAELKVEGLANADFERLFLQIKVSQAQSFFAVPSLEKANKSFLPADLAICSNCVQELKQAANRRRGYPYISCAQCGPRYTIMRRLPYDRKNTTMDIFAMCPACQKDYTSFGALRQHAETISCHHCGPQLYGDVEKAKKLLLAEQLILVKAIGGFNLVCLATSEKAVAKLRALKQRPTKPFAVMVGSLKEAEALCELNHKEAELLTSAIRPIVLLKAKKNAMKFLAKGVAEQCSSLGVMLPSMGFYYQLCELGLPLIVTSCNYSGAPIIYKDEEALAFYEEQPELAGIFTYNREILRPADDAVVRVVVLEGKNFKQELVQVLRRTRGYLPEPVRVAQEGVSVLALGAEMEPGFALTKGNKSYVAQVPGHLEEERTEIEYLKLLEAWEDLLEIKLESVVSDLHPGYSSTMLGQKLAEAKQLPFVQLQHHQAHALSVMAEHRLKGPCLAVCFDGTGYGQDGTIWGGEFLLCEGKAFKRLGNLEPILMVGGDESMKQAWKSALCYLAAAEKIDKSVFQEKRLQSYDERYKLVKAALAGGFNTIENSSMGRLFDAAAAVLDIADYNSHQGRCAMALEYWANWAIQERLSPEIMRFVRVETASQRLVWSPMEIIAKLFATREMLDSGGFSPVEKQQFKAQAALGFHRVVIAMVAETIKQLSLSTGIKQVVLGGGCFVNRILLEGCYRELTELGIKVYFNQQVPPGDGGIALGQAYYGLL